MRSLTEFSVTTFILKALSSDLAIDPRSRDYVTMISACFSHHVLSPAKIGVE